MALFLITLVSWTSKRTGLVVLDTDSGFRYLQDDYPAAHQLPFSPYRSISLHKNHIYLTTSSSIRIYDCRHKTGKPCFSLQQEVRHFDWLLSTGLPPYVGLVPILISRKRNRILVANNSQCAIDELSLDGDFIKRYSLWDISPDIFKQPEQFGLNFTYGQTRQLCETSDGSIYLTVANCNSSGKGEIIDFDTGVSLLEGLHDPNGGTFSNGFYVLQDTTNGSYGSAQNNGRLLAYRIKKYQKIGFDGLAWETTLECKKNKGNQSPQQLQGIAVSDQEIYCGAGFYGKPSDQKSANRIVSFDILTGCQQDSFELPDLMEFRNPRVLAMTLIPDDWFPTHTKGLTFFLGGKQLPPKLYQSTTEKEGTTKNKPATERKEKKADKNQRENLVCGPQSVTIDRVSLCYHRTGNFIFSFNKRDRMSRDFWALRDISVSFNEGDTIGLIGRNGSGKSTLSMMISGALKPDKGKLTTLGKVQLLALGIGFRPQLTGRENVMISGAILGMPRKKIREKMAEIEAFAELGEFFDEPIRTYSAGMKSRLGFAVSTAVEPDILILDEVMSTGDAAFRNKANKRMEQMREKTKTVIIVSHNSAQVKELCSRVVWLERGRLFMDGSTERILPVYEDFCKRPDQWLFEHPETADLLSES